MIEVKNIVKTFGDFNALDGVNMHIQNGSIYGLVGPNGAGKTTLMNTLCGIYKAAGGEITVDGEAVYENNDVKKRIVYISDDVFYFHNSTTKSLKDLYKGIYSDFDENKFQEYAKYFPNINQDMNIRRLSKGMKKQVAFWIAICCSPEILVLDEPVDGLDPMMRHQIWRLIINEVSEREMTVLISSHNLRELEDVCDTVGIMNKGKVFLESSLDDLKTNLSKIQLSFAEEINTADIGIKILKEKKTGRVYELIVSGDKTEVINKINEFNPLFVEALPLTLEEIFIYEMGEVDNEIKQILI
ncbi:MAG: ABC transporter ATP-binding protein [Eubacterium sp.]|nr:ABC transporter ATP-binding protein [Eubacterium sp.]MBR4241252.1 ABC transporter ATP-binding protein [Eubacterium sp.]MBR7060926.1 ABC transporter ATP-binding protein [Eubacterium sp.]